MKRKVLSRGRSKRLFTSGAMNIHPINTSPISNRGGLRL